MSIAQILVNSPQASHAPDACFDHNVSFKDRGEVTQAKALTVQANRLADVIALSKPQNALQDDLKKDGNIVFIGDTHLCHEFNEKAFKEIITTIGKWLSEGKKISRIVFSGDLVHRFDQRFTKFSSREIPAPVEPEGEVIARLERAISQLQRLRDAAGPNIDIDYIFGNHELDLGKHHPQTTEILLSALKEMKINVLTKDHDALVDIGNPKDKIKMSHRPIFRWAHRYSQKFFGEGSRVFSGVTQDLEFRNQFEPEPGAIIAGSHYHAPVVMKNGKVTYVSTPSLIESFEAGIDTFPEAFMVINPKGSRKIHMVKVDGQTMEYLVV